MQDDEAQEALEEVMIDVAYELNTKGYPAELVKLQPHLRFVANSAIEGNDERAATLLSNLGYHLGAIADYANARPYSEQALAVREQVLGPTHPDTALSLNNLAILRYYDGHFAQAAKLTRRAFLIWEQALGSDHPDTISSRQSLMAIEERLQGTQPQRREEQIGEIISQAEANIADMLAANDAEQRIAFATALEQRAQWAENGEEAGSPYLALAARLRELARTLDIKQENLRNDDT